jgi:hypothetical protein
MLAYGANTLLAFTGHTTNCDVLPFDFISVLLKC